MELLKKIKSLFFKKKITYSYKLLKESDKILDFILPDIIAYNNNIKKILKDNNFLEDSEYKHIIKISSETISSKKIYYWCSNHGKRLDNLDKEIIEFLKLSNEFIKRFNTLKNIKQNDNLFKFNIRLLQPYIINLETIREELLMK